MKYDQIIQEITERLTGDWETDINYLRNETEKYEEFPEGLEIIRGIGGLIFEIMPEDSKNELEFSIKNDQLHLSNKLLEIQNKIQNNDLDEAEKLVVKFLPDERMFQNDETSVYYTFRNPIEELFYKEKFKPKKSIRIAPFPYNEIYQFYVYLLVEKSQYENAFKFIDCALNRNPLFSEILFEKAEIYKKQGNLEEFRATTIQCLDLIYTSMQMGRYFRNLGYYFIEKQKWDAAICSYLMSINWNNDEMAQGQLAYISQKTGINIRANDYKNCFEILEKEDVQQSPNVLWIDIALAIAESENGKEDLDLAQFCYAIIYDLTGDKEVLETIQACEELREQRSKIMCKKGM